MHRSHNNNSRTSKIIDNSQDEPQKATESNSVNIQSSRSSNILFIEPFFSGSHKQLIDLLCKNFQEHTLVTLTGKKWPWRARCSALIISSKIPQVTTEKVLFCSSVLSLAELLGIRPDLIPLRKIVYFHENQFVYPIRVIKDRDIQYAYNQITTSLAADEILFNSQFNYDSFIGNFNKVVKLLPDYRPKGLLEKIQPKCKVLYFPVEYPLLACRNKSFDVLQIVWPHRWEFDKAPETLINILRKLKAAGENFIVHMLGGGFEDVPDIIKDAREELKDNIGTFGFIENKSQYYEILQICHIVLSTAIHEFFGVSMLEATYCGCFPIAPNSLVYPEIYPANCLYHNEEECLQMLIKYCKQPQQAAKDHTAMPLDYKKFSSDNLLVKYQELLTGIE